jgi:hypothetical protein
VAVGFEVEAVERGGFGDCDGVLLRRSRGVD